MNVVVKEIVVLVVAVSLFQPASLAQGIIGRRAHPNIEPEAVAYDAKIVNRIEGNLQLPESCKRQASIIFQIGRDGRISRVTVLQSSGSAIADFACLEAVLSCSPLTPPPKTSDLEMYQGAPGRIDFAVRRSGKTASLFFSENPQTKGKVALLHLIPADVLQRYPGVCNEADIRGLDNIAPVSLQSIRLNLSATPGHESSSDEILAGSGLKSFFEDWQTFFEKNITTTRQALLDERSRLKKRYADLFALK